MGTTVSNLKFWEDIPSLFDKKDEDNKDSVYLSYNVFLGLTILGGYIGLDHLYLRSPVTFLAKLIINFLCFGVWFWYDILQAVWNSDVVKLYGLSIPVLGPKGIGAGVLAKEKPSKMHWNFLIYSLCLLGGGIFGLDSFLVGDNRSGLIRLLSLITVIFAPVAIGWWLYNLFWFFTDTEYTINSNSDFFGRTAGSFTSRLIAFIPSFMIPIIESVLGPITASINTIDHTVQLATTAAEKIPEAVTVVKGLVEAGSKIGAVTPLSSLATTEALQKTSDTERAKKKTQTGGSLMELGKTALQSTVMSGGEISEGLNALPYTLIGTVIFISLAGFIVTYYRAKKNVTPEYDDSPPEPGVLRKPDQEKPRSTA
jgi:TM2 domain-containing membrane protein YozV